jgi:hypothetical protein
MCTRPALLVALICLSLLTMQISGLHLHVSAGSDSTALHGTHVHDAGLEGHDHDADVDVSSFEPATAWSKLLLFLSGPLFALLMVNWSGGSVWPPLTERLAIRWRSRWRPPLRAPPRTPSDCLA